MEREYPDRPIVAVGVVVLKKDTVLLIRRSKEPRPDAWSIPGGAQELGETLEEAAKREVWEETSIIIDDLFILDVVDYVDKQEDGIIKHHYSLIDYASTYQAGKLAAGDDAQQAKWVPLNKLSEYNLWSETEKIIYKAVKILTDQNNKDQND